ncbi:MAG: septum formation initiator family protein [Gammaproteobacteria bacterium]
MLFGRFSLLLIALLGLLVFLQGRLWFEAGGIRDFLQLKQNIAVQMTENEQLKKRNEELVFQIERLQHGQDAIEARARNELGMVKKDETFYQIVK